MNGFIVGVFLILSVLFNGYLIVTGLTSIKAGWILWGLSVVSFCLIVVGAGLYLQHEWEVLKKEGKK